MTKLTPEHLQRMEYEEEKQVSQKGMKWLLSLERDYFPIELARSYPRIVNKLAQTWDIPGEGTKYLDGLLLDDRGDRQGFPMSVLRELIALREFYNTLITSKDDIWDKGHLAQPNKKV